jgi:hypothetical protein
LIIIDVMNKITLLLVLMPFFSFAQEQGNPFEKANIIIVYHKIDIETAFDEMYNLLVDNSYLVIEANERFHFLVTEEVKKKGPYWLSIHCRVDKDKILLSGTSSGRKATYTNTKKAKATKI